MEETHSKEADYAEFKALIDRYYAVWSTKDGKVNIDAAAQYYAKDADLLFWDILPPLQGYVGWEDYKVGVQKNAYDHLASFKPTPYDDLRVTQQGDVAWTTVTFHASAKFKDGRVLEVDSRQTTIWERRNGEWLIVHEHMSVPLLG